MHIAGIDFSINHPSVCLIRDGVPHRFLVFPKDLTKGHHALQGTEVEMYAIDRLEVANHVNTTDRERLLINNAMILADAVVRALPDDLDAIGIENLAFSAKGNRLAEIAGYQYILREKLIQKYSVHHLYFFAANTVKAKAGSGRFDKNQMIEAFLNCDLHLKVTDLLRDQTSLFKKTKNWTKPVDDVADSYWIARCTLDAIS